MKNSIYLLLLSFAFVLIPPLQTKAHVPTLRVQIMDNSGLIQTSFEIPTANEAGGAKIATADLGTDGTPEIIIGNGLGNEPRVTVYRLDGSTVGSFLAYDPSMGTGITLAVCDPDGDGTNDIITGTQYGGGPHVRTFDNIGTAKNNEGFMAYAESFRGGVHVSCGDLDGDGKDELVTSPGPSGGPHIKVWKWENDAWKMTNEFYAFAKEETNGVVTTVHDKKLFVTLQKTNGNHVVKSYVIHSSITEEKEQENFTITTTGIFFANEKLFSTSDDEGYITKDSFAFVVDVPFGSVNATAVDINNDGVQEIIAVADRPIFAASKEAKRIEIDLSEQRLYAYENGILSNTFLISAARAPWQTPIGEHSVLAKLPFVHYAWFYGSGSSENYDLGVIPWNLRIYPHIYIHYAPWHNNFGHPMSHGCVNVNLENIKWIYDWSEVEISVEVRA